MITSEHTPKHIRRLQRARTDAHSNALLIQKIQEQNRNLLNTINAQKAAEAAAANAAAQNPNPLPVSHMASGGSGSQGPGASHGLSTADQQTSTQQQQLQVKQQAQQYQQQQAQLSRLRRLSRMSKFSKTSRTSKLTSQGQQQQSQPGGPGGPSQTSQFSPANIISNIITISGPMQQLSKKKNVTMMSQASQTPTQSSSVGAEKRAKQQQQQIQQQSQTQSQQLQVQPIVPTVDPVTITSNMVSAISLRQSSNAPGPSGVGVETENNLDPDTRSPGPYLQIRIQQIDSQNSMLNMTDSGTLQSVYLDNVIKRAKQYTQNQQAPQSQQQQQQTGAPTFSGLAQQADSVSQQSSVKLQPQQPQIQPNRYGQTGGVGPGPSIFGQQSRLSHGQGIIPGGQQTRLSHGQNLNLALARLSKLQQQQQQLQNLDTTDSHHLGGQSVTTGLLSAPRQSQYSPKHPQIGTSDTYQQSTNVRRFSQKSSTRRRSSRISAFGFNAPHMMIPDYSSQQQQLTPRNQQNINEKDREQQQLRDRRVSFMSSVVGIPNQMPMSKQSTAATNYHMGLDTGPGPGQRLSDQNNSQITVPQTPQSQAQTQSQSQQQQQNPNIINSDIQSYSGISGSNIVTVQHKKRNIAPYSQSIPQSVSGIGTSTTQSKTQSTNKTQSQSGGQGSGPGYNSQFSTSHIDSQSEAPGGGGFAQTAQQNQQQPTAQNQVMSNNQQQIPQTVAINPNLARLSRLSLHHNLLGSLDGGGALDPNNNLESQFSDDEPDETQRLLEEELDKNGYLRLYSPDPEIIVSRQPVFYTALGMKIINLPYFMTFYDILFICVFMFDLHVKILESLFGFDWVRRKQRFAEVETGLVYQQQLVDSGFSLQKVFGLTGSEEDYSSNDYKSAVCEIRGVIESGVTYHTNLDTVVVGLNRNINDDTKIVRFGDTLSYDDDIVVNQHSQHGPSFRLTTQSFPQHCLYKSSIHSDLAIHPTLVIFRFLVLLGECLRFIIIMNKTIFYRCLLSFDSFVVGLSLFRFFAAFLLLHTEACSEMLTSVELWTQRITTMLFALTLSVFLPTLDALRVAVTDLPQVALIHGTDDDDININEFDLKDFDLDYDYLNDLNLNDLESIIAMSNMQQQQQNRLSVLNVNQNQNDNYQQNFNLNIMTNTMDMTLQDPSNVGQKVSSDTEEMQGTQEPLEIEAHDYLNADRANDFNNDESVEIFKHRQQFQHGSFMTNHSYQTSQSQQTSKQGQTQQLQQSQNLNSNQSEFHPDRQLESRQHSKVTTTSINVVENSTNSNTAAANLNNNLNVQNQYLPNPRDTALYPSSQVFMLSPSISKRVTEITENTTTGPTNTVVDNLNANQSQSQTQSQQMNNSNQLSMSQSQNLTVGQGSGLQSQALVQDTQSRRSQYTVITNEDDDDDLVNNNTNLQQFSKPVLFRESQLQPGQQNRNINSDPQNTIDSGTNLNVNDAKDNGNTVDININKFEQNQEQTNNPDLNQSTSPKIIKHVFINPVPEPSHSNSSFNLMFSDNLSKIQNRSSSMMEQLQESKIIGGMKQSTERVCSICCGKLNFELARVQEDSTEDEGTTVTTNLSGSVNDTQNQSTNVPVNDVNTITTTTKTGQNTTTSSPNSSGLLDSTTLGTSTRSSKGPSSNRTSHSQNYNTSSSPKSILYRYLCKNLLCTHRYSPFRYRFRPTPETAERLFFISLYLTFLIVLPLRYGVLLPFTDPELLDSRYQLENLYLFWPQPASPARHLVGGAATICIFLLKYVFVVLRGDDFAILRGRIVMDRGSESGVNNMGSYSSNGQGGGPGQGIELQGLDGIIRTVYFRI